MAQFPVTVNLNAAVIPFFAAFKGQSVIMPNRGDMNAGPARDFSGDTLEAASNVPQLYWAENVLPSQEGYFSVGYAELVPAIATPSDVDYEITLFDGDSNKGMLAVTTDRQLWLLSGVGGVWTQVPTSGPWTGRATTGTAYGTCYIFLPGLGLHSVGLNTKVLTKVTPDGLDESIVVGICDSQSYLIAYSQNLVAWSSALDALDFKPSEITGAGAGTPEGLRGQIVFAKAISKGFIIYTTAITMASEYTGNTRFPWIFRALNNGSGVSGASDISQDSGLASHFMWAASGFTEVNIQQCTLRFPQLTDFLAGEAWEEFHDDINEVIRTKLVAQVRVRASLIASRFLCVSYGLPDSKDFEFVNVFDSVLQRWGRLRFTHRQCIEIVADSEMHPVSWDDARPIDWDESTKTWSSYALWNNGTAKAKNTLGFIQADGSVHIAQMGFNVSGSNGVLLLGRLQMVRGHVSYLHGALLQGIDEGKSNFSLVNRVTAMNNGVSFSQILQPMSQLNMGPYTRQYGSRMVGKNHNLIVKGSFHLTSAELTLSDAGRR